MNSDQLDKLRIQSSDRRRPRGIFAIFAAVILLTGVALLFAWPRDSDGRRTFGKPRAAATNSTASATTAPAQNTNGLLFTVSGYIINRERIELSPRFLGVVKWIGVKKATP